MSVAIAVLATWWILSTTSSSAARRRVAAQRAECAPQSLEARLPQLGQVVVSHQREARQRLEVVQHGAGAVRVVLPLRPTTDADAARRRQPPPQRRHVDGDARPLARGQLAHDEEPLHLLQRQRLEHEVAIAADERHLAADRPAARQQPVDNLELALAGHVAPGEEEAEAARAVGLQLGADPVGQRALEAGHETRARRRAQRGDARGPPLVVARVRLALLALVAPRARGATLALCLQLGDRRGAVKRQHDRRPRPDLPQCAVQHLKHHRDRLVLVARVPQRIVHERVEVEGDHVDVARRDLAVLARQGRHLHQSLRRVRLQPRDEARDAHERRVEPAPSSTGDESAAARE
mmetsp:Transcript_32183/g.101077  ORF Transcript_32183/g.101077 Transcript_32183/m.101077 type:complete len:350 (+) Transcript_32183:593-1642(+)